MRPHPRIRKTIKWGGVTCAAILAATWWYSGFGTWVLQCSNGWFTSLSCGSVGVGNQGASTPVDPNLPAGWYSIPSNQFRFDEYARWPQYVSFADGYREVRVPLWMPALASLVASVLAWRLNFLAARRAKIGACPTCSYSRTGLAPSSPCPECGAAAPQA